MTLLSFYIALTFPINNGSFTGTYYLDINPLIGVYVDSWNFNTATTIPGFVFFGPQTEKRNLKTGFYLKIYEELGIDNLRHEMAHSRQQAALGPAFWLSYAATLGRPFEPYDSFLHLGLAPFSVGFQVFTEEDMWMPSPEMEQAYPLFRLTFEREAATLELLPGYYPRYVAP